MAFQIILAALFLFGVWRAVDRYRACELSKSALFFWLCFWLGGLVVAIYPDSTMYFARRLGVGRGSDLVVYLALVLVFFSFLKILTRLARTERNLTKLTQELALLKKNAKL